MRHQVISKNQAAALIGLTLLLQFLLQSYFVPLDELLTAKRLAHIDSVYHQYMMEATAAAHAVGAQAVGAVWSTRARLGESSASKATRDDMCAP